MPDNQAYFENEQCAINLQQLNRNSQMKDLIWFRVQNSGDYPLIMYLLLRDKTVGTERDKSEGTEISFKKGDKLLTRS